VESIQGLESNPIIDSTTLPLKYKFVSASVINNSYYKSNNSLTLNKGIKDEVKIDLGVISSKGLVGIIENVSSNYSTVQSILNTKSQINAMLKNSNHFGSLVWDTKHPNIVQLIDIPRLAPVVVGDTVITGGMSTIFPKGILIGVIKDFYINQDKNSYTLNINLFNDMTNLEHVYIIDNLDSEEINLLEKPAEDAK
jgi:rod shape-determining protein MreC